MLVEIVLALVTIFLVYMAFRRPPDLPPGLWGLPLIGYIPLSGDYIDDMLSKLQKKYGDIYIWRFGTRLQVFIHDYHILKQVFSSPEYIDRPDMEMMKGFEDKAYGISGSNGIIWQTNRRFFLRHLKDLGMGKSHLTDAIEEQAKVFLDVLKKIDGKPGNIPDELNYVIMNLIWKMTANKQWDMDSPKHNYLTSLIANLGESSNALAMTDMFPWTRTFLPDFLFSRIFKVDKVKKILEEFSKFFYEMIDEHKKTLDPDDPKDLIDAYLIERKEWEQKGSNEEEGVRNDIDLKMVLFDALFAGSDTTYNTLMWIYLYLAKHQDKQRKMQKEIDDVLPKGTFFTLEHKPRLPYTEAVINEVMRMSSIGNVGVPHSPVKDTILAGYRIPKGAIITSPVPSIHMDPRYWDQPEEFLPERWLNEDGKFTMKKEGNIVFGVGKRSCPGEALARQEVWVFTTAVFQQFNISPVEGNEVDLLPNHDVFVMHNPRKQDIIFSSRTTD